jgi:hypothetical protein
MSLRRPPRCVDETGPPAQQYVPVRAGLVVRLVEGERAGGGRVGQADDVHAAGRGVAVVGEGWARAIIAFAYRSI